MRVAKHPRTPVLARRHRHLQRLHLDLLPPLQAMYLRKSQPRHQVLDALRHHHLRRPSRRPPRHPHYPSQRGNIQVVHMRMRHQHQVDRRQLPHQQPRPPLPPQHHQPLRKHRVHQDLLAAHLQQKRRVPDERHPRLPCPHQLERPRLPGHRPLMALAHQPHQLPHLRRHKRSLSPHSTLISLDANRLREDSTARNASATVPPDGRIYQRRRI